MVRLKFKENDIYALEIKNINEKYDGRYIIIIKCSIDGWNDNINKRLFRFKITKDKKIPKLEELDDLEYIITHFQHELNKYFPGEGVPFEELRKKRDKIKVYPDKYGYLYTCISGIYFVNKDIPNNIMYIGNKKLKLPKHEYIPFTEYGYKCDFRLWNKIVERLVEKYEDYNLGKSKWFTEEGAKVVKKARLYDIGATIECDNLCNYLKEKGILDKLFEDEEEIEDSLTYVGGEDEDPFEE